ncbi:MAG: cation transporter [Bacteroidetes bacterium]|nr:cation transporter [Bacteroidota bacterium]
MAHLHTHSDHNLNEHSTLSSNLNRAFIVGIVLNLAFVVVESVAGLMTGSLGLLTDAGHNLSDVAALALSLFAFRLAKIKPSVNYTYGYSKTTILVALANAVILLIAVGGIGIEAVKRFFHPEPLQGDIISIVAGIGIVVNGASAFLFIKNKEDDLNVKGAYLHLVADALVSLGVLIAGVLIMFTGWYWLDTVISLVIIVVIVYSSWHLLADSLRLSMDAVPPGVDIDKLKQLIMSNKGVTSVHHIHVWALSTTVNAMTAHLCIEESMSGTEEMDMKHHIKQELTKLKVHHATFETERGPEKCTEEVC